jgi:hypothetical protein
MVAFAQTQWDMLESAGETPSSFGFADISSSKGQNSDLRNLLIASLRQRVSSFDRPPQIGLTADGHRLHLQDGPIDLIIGADGPDDAIQTAYAAAVERFTGLLDALCLELTILRAPAHPDGSPLRDTVARCMYEAVRPFSGDMFITPMAAVAGSVAEEVLSAMITAAPDLTRAYVNNGGDIALHLQPGYSFRSALVSRPDVPAIFAETEISYGSGIRGIATSGAPGRSFSLGIADAVTVLAKSASEADAAATVIANAVDLLGHPAVIRAPARSIQPDSDLGDLLVTLSVGAITQEEIETALANGQRIAEMLIDDGLIIGAALHLRGSTRISGKAIEKQVITREV